MSFFVFTNQTKYKRMQEYAYAMLEQSYQKVLEIVGKDKLLSVARFIANEEFEANLVATFSRDDLITVRLIDDEAILASAAYVDLNPIRAAMAETIEDSQFTSARLRLQSLVDAATSTNEGRVASDEVLNGSALQSTGHTQHRSLQHRLQSVSSPRILSSLVVYKQDVYYSNLALRSKVN